MVSYWCMDEIMSKLDHDHPVYLEKMMKSDKIFIIEKTKMKKMNVESHCVENEIEYRHGKSDTTSMFIPGPLIVGAGPSGLAVAASLKKMRVSSIVLERSSCIGSLWQLKTYDRLCLHLPKQFCQLPHMAFPEDYPAYPNRNQFISYLHDYAEKFGIRPRFNERVVGAEYDPEVGFWRVTSVRACGGGAAEEERRYVCRWLVVATGENAEAAVPEIPGIKDFHGTLMHSFSYRNGEEFAGKRVLVVGCGNSGMEVSLDLCNHSAKTSVVVRDTVHVLPREVLGRSTFELSIWLLKWFPVHLVDRILLLASWFMFGDTARFGLSRPSTGPMELKSLCGKTPVLDVGTICKIRSGEIKVFPGIKRVTRKSVEFENGESEKFDAIILATGYRSNVPYWLKENEMFSKKDGFPQRSIPNGWKGENGLYAVGFSKKGLLGTSIDAQRIAEDIQRCWQEEGRLRSPSSKQYSLLPNSTY